MTWDGGMLLWIQEFVRMPALTAFFRFITSLGDHGMIWIVLAVLCLFFPKTRKAGTAILGALAVSFIINNLILKNVIARTRPYEVIEGLQLLIERQHDFSFPSGHTASSLTAAVAFFLTAPKGETGKSGLFFKAAKAALLLLAVGISISRLYVGVHYPTDVAIGALSGILIAIAVSNVVNAWWKDSWEKDRDSGGVKG